MANKHLKFCAKPTCSNLVQIALNNCNWHLDYKKPNHGIQEQGF
jgi:hypothetical protein